MEVSVIHSRFAFNYLRFAEVMKQKFKSGFIEDSPVFRSAAQVLLLGMCLSQIGLFTFLLICFVLFSLLESSIMQYRLWI